MTHWASDGQLANAWIEYRLDKPQVVDEVELKLIGWRLRSYPLRITMDGRTVYEGVPAKSLGYVVLPLKPLKGSRLRIALTAPTVDRDAFGKIVEVNGAKASFDTGAEKVAAGGRLGNRGGRAAPAGAMADVSSGLGDPFGGPRGCVSVGGVVAATAPPPLLL
ncbi:hypothetical protein ACRAWD_18940 [Caulobacter segnis]